MYMDIVSTTESITPSGKRIVESPDTVVDITPPEESPIHTALLGHFAEYYGMKNLDNRWPEDHGRTE